MNYIKMNHNNLASSKIIKDSIHGFIEFNGEVENSLKKLLSDQFFQRLRRVKQLGFSDYVFPSATHTRFAHSLGVYSVAKRMLSVVEPDVKNSDWTTEGQACLGAALLHDIGHGMFSHAFEKAIDFYLKRNLNSNEYSILKESSNHENISRKIITESSISEILREIGGSSFPKKVSDMVQKKNARCIYTSIVSSQLDADRLDYVKRDPYFAGVSSGGIDIDWLLRNLNVEKNKNGRFLYINSKAYISIEQFAVTLLQLYPTIYLHKKTRGLEYMFALLISRVFELISDGKESKAGLTKMHPLVRFFKKPDNLDNIVLLDDTLFWGSLYLFQEAEDPVINTLARRIVSREIYPAIDVWKIADQITSEKRYFQKMSASERSKEIHIICKDVCSDISHNKKFLQKNCFYDAYDRPIYKAKNIQGGDPQQINIKVGEEFFDIASISPLVASAASFNIHRIYYDDKNDNFAAKIEKSIRSAIKNKI